MLVKIIRGEPYNKWDENLKRFLEENEDARKSFEIDIDNVLGEEWAYNSDDEVEEYEFDYDYNYDGEPVDEEINSSAMNRFNGLLTNNVVYLDCSNNKLSELPPFLPESLIELHCEFNWLRELPELPSRLKVLDCSYQTWLLQEFPVFPSSLKELYCNNNALDKLPCLPMNLTVLDCSNNDLTHIPYLPHTLVTLDCTKNCISELPSKLPPHLEILKCENNKIYKLPCLPETLTLFEASGNPIHHFYESYCQKNKNLYNSYKKSVIKIEGWIIKCKLSTLNTD